MPRSSKRQLARFTEADPCWQTVGSPENSDFFQSFTLPALTYTYTWTQQQQQQHELGSVWAINCLSHRTAGGRFFSWKFDNNLSTGAKNERHVQTVHFFTNLSEDSEGKLYDIAGIPKVLVGLYFEAKMALHRHWVSPLLLFSPQNSWVLQNISWHRGRGTEATSTQGKKKQTNCKFVFSFSQDLISSWSLLNLRWGVHMLIGLCRFNLFFFYESWQFYTRCFLFYKQEKVNCELEDIKYMILSILQRKMDF